MLEVIRPQTRLQRVIAAIRNFFNATRIPPVEMSATFVKTASPGQPGSRTLTHIGEYKEIAPAGFSADNERRGTETTPPASYPHYLPVWDDKTK
jgi:hypothetical protein